MNCDLCGKEGAEGRTVRDLETGEEYLICLDCDPDFDEEVEEDEDET